MKNIILLFLLILSNHLLLFSQINSKELSKLKLNGSIKTITKVSYKGELRGDSIVKVKKESQYPIYYDLFARYDKDGNIIEEVWYDASGDVKLKKEYDYNKYGIDRIIINDSYDNSREELVNRYGANGYIVESTKGSSKYIFKYDEKRNRISNRWIDDTLRSSYRTFKYKYDINNNQIEESDYSMDNELLRMETDLFDSIGSNIEHAWYEKGLYLGKDTFRITMVTNMIYNENNDLVKKIWKKRKDTNRHLTEEEYDYVYDKKNNWIRKIIKKKSGIYLYSDTEKIAFYIIERKIEYYDD